MIAIYIRVSSQQQVKEGYSLQAQKNMLTSFCEAREWSNYKFYIEEGLSAKNDKRPVYQDMMRHVEEGKIKTVLVYKLDRIMRSIGDLDKMLKTFDKHECSFVSATEPFDTTSPTGKLFIYIVGALAQWENEIKSERIKFVLEEKVSDEGIWIGNVPYPFDLDEKTQKLIPNPERAEKTLEIIEMYMSGMGTHKIAEYMNATETTDKTWRANTIYRILKNPALYGATRWVNKVYENTHQGIISKEKFELLQRMMKDRADTRYKDVESTYLFQSVLACPTCERTLSVARYFRKRKDGTTYQGATYRCTWCAKENKFNHHIGEQKFLDALYKYMQNVKIEHLQNVELKNEKPDYVKQFEAIENKRRKYQRAWANDMITDDEFKELMNETREVYEELKLKIKKEENNISIDPKRIAGTIMMFNKNFKELTIEEKRKFIASFIRKIYFKVTPQPPKRPEISQKGKPKVEITKVIFY